MAPKCACTGPRRPVREPAFAPSRAAHAFSGEVTTLPATGLLVACSFTVNSETVYIDLGSTCRTVLTSNPEFGYQADPKQQPFL